MPRDNKSVTDIREALEGAVGLMVRVDHFQSFVRTRVIQAQQRTGLDALLGPALDDLTDISQSAKAAQRQVNDAISTMLVTSPAPLSVEKSDKASWLDNGAKNA
jgi:hypothetical protein